VFENERQNWQAETDRHETNMFFDDEMWYKISFCSKKRVLYQISIYVHNYNV
jgi:hypothetical protein